MNHFRIFALVSLFVFTAISAGLFLRSVITAFQRNTVLFVQVAIASFLVGFMALELLYLIPLLGEIGESP